MSLDARLRRYLTKELRRSFNYSPVKREALKLLPDECGLCHGQAEKYHLDHISPVVPVDRAIDSTEYFNRLFCLTGGVVDLSLLMKVCAECHSRKSDGEMALRAKNKTGPYSPEANQKRKETHARKAKKRASLRKRSR